MFDYMVNGKKVTFKAKLPLREARSLPKLLAATAADDYDSQIAVMVILIDSWDYDGDPSDPKSYEDMDILSEIVPLSKLCVEYLSAKSGDSKN